jgi:hypothetical protein
MINTCQNCKWSRITWAQAKPGDFPTHHLRCNPGGDNERDQVAEIPCLKWELDDGEL